MVFLKENKVYIFFIYINLLFIITMASICYKINNFNYLYITALFLAGFLSYWFYHSALSKMRFKIVFILILLSVMIWVYFYNKEALTIVIRAHIIYKFNYINSLVAEAMETEFWDYKGIFILVLPIITWIMLFLTAKGFANSILVLNLALITMIWYFGYTEEVKKCLPYYLFLNLVTYAVNNYMNNVKKLSKKGINIRIELWKILTYIIIVSVIVAATTSVLPQEYSGRLTSVKESKIYNKFAKQLDDGEEKAKKHKYDLSYSGYDNNKKKLGGPVIVNKLIAFKVKSNRPYYLKGSVKDYYDGFSWQQSENEYYIKDKKDIGKKINELYNSYIESSDTIKIYPVELNTSTIFTPNHGYDAVLQEGRLFYDDIPTFMSDKVITNPYSVSFYNLYVNEDAILSSITDRHLSKEVSSSYYETYYNKYLQLPPDISERVYKLVEDITKNAKSNFAKVKVIRDYLNKNYKYTLNVSQIPQGVEFLDYFLFTEKKGYCTYFATAETIMCRIAGIPARYVEGFNMTDEKDKDNLYVVRNENAHAWSEILFMENPTSGFWYKVDAVPNAAELIHKEEEEKAESKENNNEERETEISTAPEKKLLDNKYEILKEDFTEKRISPRTLSMLYAVSVLLIFFIINFTLFFREKARIFTSKSIIPIYNYSLERLKTIGIEAPDYLGDFEMFEMLEKDLSKRLKEAGALAYREYFGGKSPDEFDKKKYYNFIEGYVKNRQSKLEYFIKKYFFIKISSLKAKIVILYKRIIQIKH